MQTPFESCGSRQLGAIAITGLYTSTEFRRVSAGAAGQGDWTRYVTGTRVVSTGAAG